MPIVDVTYAPGLEQERLVRLQQTLPEAVSVAVECPEEPYDRNLRPGDIEIHFRPRGPYDVSALDVVVEVRSRWFESRAQNRQERCNRLAGRSWKQQESPASGSISHCRSPRGPQAG